MIPNIAGALVPVHLVHVVQYPHIFIIVRRDTGRGGPRVGGNPYKHVTGYCGVYVDDHSKIITSVVLYARLAVVAPVKSFPSVETATVAAANVPPGVTAMP